MTEGHNTLTNLCAILSAQMDSQRMMSFTQQEWEVISSLAIQEATGPLLYAQIQPYLQQNLLCVSNDFVESLRKEYIQTAAMNSIVRLKVARLMQMCQDEEIDILILKGAYLAFWVYADPALRPMTDVDVLVKPSDFSRFMKGCKHLGYSLERVSHHATMDDRNQSSHFLEVHWNLPGAMRCPDWFFIKNERTYAHIIYVAAHIMVQHHRSSRLLWIYDLYLLLQNCIHELSIQDLWLRAQELDLDAVLFTALYQTDSLFGLPENDILTLAPVDLFNQAGNIVNTTAKSISQLPIKSRPKAIYRLVIPTLHYLRWRHQSAPAWSLPAYYPLRWIQLIGRTTSLVD